MQRQLRFGTAAGSACGYFAGYASPDQSLVNIGDAELETAARPHTHQFPYQLPQSHAHASPENMACPLRPPYRFDTKVESRIQHSEKPADSVNPENALSVRVFLLACFLGQPKSLQSRDLFTNNLCLDFVAHRDSILPRSLLQPRLHSHVFRISGHRALLLRAQKLRPHSVHTQHVCSVRIKYVCTKHDEKRPRTTSWRGRISGVGFAAKLERSNSIDRAWASLANRSARQTWGLFASGPSFGFMFSYYRSTTIRTLSVELVWPSVGRLLRLRQKYRDFETQKWWCRIDFRNAGYVSI